MNHPGAVLAGAMLGSLTLMGASRKVFGPEVVSQRLVAHRADIGVAAFFTIGVSACTELGVIGSAWAAGGDYHIFAAAVAQVGYLASLVARDDLPPSHPHRLFLLVLVWLGLSRGSAAVQIVLEVASLWIVKLKLRPAAAESPPPKSKGKSAPPPPKSKSKASPKRKSSRKSRAK